MIVEGVALAGQAAMIRRNGVDKPPFLPLLAERASCSLLLRNSGRPASEGLRIAGRVAP